MRTLAELKNVRVADMSHDEVRLVVSASAAKLKAELEANAPAIQRVLSDREQERSRPDGDWPFGREG
jgi:hypothetical protein